jgi:hypothetical protein
MMVWITENLVVDNICASQTYPHTTDTNTTVCGNVENYVDIIHSLPTGIFHCSSENIQLSTDSWAVSSSTSDKKTYIMKGTIRRGALWA